MYSATSTRLMLEAHQILHPQWGSVSNLIQYAKKQALELESLVVAREPFQHGLQLRKDYSLVTDDIVGKVVSIKYLETTAKGEEIHTIIGKVTGVDKYNTEHSSFRYIAIEDRVALSVHPLQAFEITQRG